MNWEKMKEPIVEVYLKHYTHREISDMTAFYDSETGRSMIRKMPVVMQDTMLISQSILKDFLPRLQVLMTQMTEDVLAAKQAEK